MAASDLIGLTAFALAAICFLLIVAMFVMAIRLKEHRTDIDANQPMMEGASWAGIDNILNPDNYDEEGKRRLPFLKAGIVLEIVVFLVIGLLMTS